MAYDFFTISTPVASQTRQETVDSTRLNLMALRDAVVIGIVPGWSMVPGDSSDTATPTYTATTADPAAPQILKYTTAANEELLIWLTWSSGNVTVAKFYYSPDNITGYPGNRLSIGQEAISYDGSSNVTGIVWT